MSLEPGGFSSALPGMAGLPKIPMGEWGTPERKRRGGGGGVGLFPEKGQDLEIGRECGLIFQVPAWARKRRGK